MMFLVDLFVYQFTVPDPVASNESIPTPPPPTPDMPLRYSYDENEPLLGYPPGAFRRSMLSNVVSFTLTLFFFFLIPIASIVHGEFQQFTSYCTFYLLSVVHSDAQLPSSSCVKLGETNSGAC